MTKSDKELFITKLKESVATTAEQRRYDAGMQGARDDGGAGVLINRLEMFLDGYNFALTGETSKYNQILKDFNKKKRLESLENDTDFQRYKELKKKFGDLDDSL